MEVKGRHVLEGKPTTVILNDGQIREALAEPVRQIVQAVRDGLERIPPELSADVYDRGIVLSGGGALLQQLDDAPAPRDRSAGVGGRGSAVVGGARRRQDAVGLRAAAEALDRLRCGAAFRRPLRRERSQGGLQAAFASQTHTGGG